jgi:hypothetical protein
MQRGGEQYSQEVERLEAFAHRLRGLSTSDGDRSWIESVGWNAFIELRDTEPQLRLEHDRAWTKALVRVSRSPYSCAPATDPEEYHLGIVYAFGSRGAKLLRLRKQITYFRIPWTKKDFVECTRIAFLHKELLKSPPSASEIDTMWSRRSADVVARQILTVFTGDHRIEQQKDCTGEASLLRAMQLDDGQRILFGHFEEAFLGRQQELAFLKEAFSPSIEQKNWRPLSRWISLAAQRFCALHDLQERQRMSDILLDSFWELGDQNILFPIEEL